MGMSNRIKEVLRVLSGNAFLVPVLLAFSVIAMAFAVLTAQASPEGDNSSNPLSPLRTASAQPKTQSPDKLVLQM